MYVLGYRDTKKDRLWFLHAAASHGNMMRTDVPLYAKAWTSVQEARLWLDNLPTHAKAQLAGRELQIFPLSVIVGAAEWMVQFEEAEQPKAKSIPRRGRAAM